MSSDKKYPINLPKTDFPMKGNLAQKSSGFVDFWSQNKIYDKIQKKTSSFPLFTFIDGPPYANGRIHLGTALNKILKDILVKQAVLSKKRCSFTPVWDCHGLPIELRALKKIKTRKPCEVRKACREEANRWVDIQMAQFQSIGVLADWDNKILTMDYQYEAEEVRLLARLVEKGLLYRGKRPIHWCFKLQTAIAASEVEYRDHQSPSVDVKFQITESKHKFPENTFLVIWTTTPWTLPANQACCLNAQLEYGLFKVDQTQDHFIIAKDLKESFEKRTSLSLKLVQSFKGADLEHTAYKHPFRDQVSKVILGSHVNLEAGTGCVHTAPAHGVDDFIVGQKYKTPADTPIDEKGRFADTEEELSGLDVFTANPIIVEKLKKSGHLVFHKMITHSYPYNPRSKAPLIFRATSQWFLNLNNGKNPVKKQALNFIEKDIKFIPENTKQRLAAMIKDSPDWCLSRQRTWGVPIVVFYCDSCSHPLADPKIILSIADQMEKTKKGLDYYFTSDEKTLLPSGTQCEKCNNSSFKKGEDILDVWFDSGVCHCVISKLKGSDHFPSDVYLEGSDQHRGWFQTSLNSSVALTGEAPFKTLITHGFVFDLEKRKMSKSAGNTVNPDDVIKKHGAEILRLWVAGSDYSQDISSGEEIFSRLTETYRRFRNTVRFLLGNLHDFNPKTDSVDAAQMQPLDLWILSLLTELTEKTKKHYENYEFHKVYHELNVFFTNRLSSLYLDIIKDRLYTFKVDSPERRSAQTALYILLKNLIQILSPITSFLSEEAYRYLPGDDKEESIFLTSFESLNFRSLDLEKQMSSLLEVRNTVSKEIEALRQDKTIGSSLEVHLLLTLPPHLHKDFSNNFNAKEFFIVSKVTVSEGKSLEIKVQKADGQKCVRCWHIDEKLNDDSLCAKCLNNL